MARLRKADVRKNAPGGLNSLKLRAADRYVQYYVYWLLI